MEVDPIYIGLTPTGYSDCPVHLSGEARLRHLAMTGQTGTGKTSFMLSMMVEDLEAGHGFAFLDPHGDAVEELLDYVPPHRMRDVLYIDFADPDRAVGLNLLATPGQAGTDPKHYDRLMQEIIATFRYLWRDTWGESRMQNIFKHTIRALIEAPQFDGHAQTLLCVAPFLNRKPFRRRILQHASPAVREYFDAEFEPLNGRQISEWVQPILNKVDQYVLSDPVRQVIGQPKSTLNLERMMDDRKVLLLNLSHGRLGIDTSSLLGSIFITAIQLAAFRRAERNRADRTPFFLFVDEFQNFATGSFPSILSEARKYGLGLTIGHQYIAQLEDEIRDAVFGAGGNYLAFRSCAEDAYRLARELDVSVEQILDLGVGEAFIKYLDGTHFSQRRLLTARPDPARRHGRAHKVRCYADRFTKPRTEIDAQIAAWAHRIVNT